MEDKAPELEVGATSSRAMEALRELALSAAAAASYAWEEAEAHAKRADELMSKAGT